MTNREVSRQGLAAAMAAIESQREVLGEVVVNTALFALRQKMKVVEGEAEPATRQQAELVVLAADLSGFTALAERMDAERVRDAINAMWEVLDAVVESWGGQVDQHAGDGLVALFGVPRSRPNDLEHALRAALTLQIELGLFNETARQEQQSWAAGWPNPTMRIGVHRGPVFFGKGGYGNRRTAVGDTVNLARSLEQAAPEGGVLVSTAIAQQLRPQFELARQIEAAADMATPVAVADSNGDEADVVLISGATRMAKVSSESASIENRSTGNGQPHNRHFGSLQPVYQVVGEKPDNGPALPGLIAGQETRFTGRERELDFLEQLLHTVVDGRFSQVVTITAGAGVGTSRLLYEFERRIKLLPGQFTLLRDQLAQLAQRPTLPLWQELVFRSCGLRLHDSPGVMREKLARAITGDRQPPAANKEAYWIADALLVDGINAAAQRPLIVEALSKFLQQIAPGATVVAFLEHLHQADDHSLDILEALVEQQSDLPLLLIATACPDFLKRRPKWHEQPSDPFTPYSHFKLQPLSAIDGRHMLSDALQRLPSPPLRLVDLITSAGQGNPLFIEETVKLLLNQGTISSGSGGRWRVNMAEVEATRLPGSLGELFRARLEQLSPEEQQLLGIAAVMGDLFWDVALWQDSGANNALSPEAVDAALARLEAERLIVKNQMWSFAGTQAYTFAHPLLGATAYHRLTTSGRRVIHRQVANWLKNEQQNGRAGRRFPIDALIAYHLEQAGGDTRPTGQEPIPAVPFLANGRQ